MEVGRPLERDQEGGLPEAPGGARLLMRWIVVLIGAFAVAYLVDHFLIGRMLASRLPYDRFETLLRTGIPRAASESGPRFTMMGASSSVYGFATEPFDRALRERGFSYSPSYNLSVVGPTPDLLWGIARRYRQALEGKDTTNDVILLDWPPAFSTKAIRKRGIVSSNIPRRGRMLDWTTFRYELSREPADAAQLVNAWLLGETAQKAVEKWFTLQLYGPTDAQLAWFVSGLDPVELARLWAESERIGWADRVLLSEGWDVSRRGGRRAPVWRTPDEIALDSGMKAARRTPQMLERARKHWENMDAFDLDFDDQALAYLTLTVRELKAISRNTFLVVMPKRDVLRFSELGQKRFVAALDQLRRDTGIEVIDVEDALPQPENYIDLAHLTEAGAELLAPILAGKVADALNVRRP